MSKLITTEDGYEIRLGSEEPNLLPVLLRGVGLRLS